MDGRNLSAVVSLHPRVVWETFRHKGRDDAMDGRKNGGKKKLDNAKQVETSEGTLERIANMQWLFLWRPTSAVWNSDLETSLPTPYS
ncbi:hypothetical protein TNIN_319201 [Trichonephila inaurata madagascariensis]|uniref:Uncharacterized protein n=1 Tax=Trichonephila inaurata madagascariensis TaxID=2747483 RepID=A0A8X6XMI8_9ARAC|nr:hypothetical protein TNIN_319201 [Trichonephila inaurata madagascariensis]